MPETWPWCPAPGLAEQVTRASNEQAMGDGYVQRAERGINPFARVFRVRFTGPLETAKAQLAFLETNSLAGFYFTPPGRDRMFVVADTWTLETIERGPADLVANVTAEFRRIYNFPTPGV